MSHFAVLRSCY